MLSRVRRRDDGDASRRILSGFWTAAVKVTIGLTLLGGLLYWGQLDPRTLYVLADNPWVIVACLGLLFLAWPLGTLRWQILLRALGMSVPFTKLFHIFSITTALNNFLLGIAGGDAARIWYVWQASGRDSSGRIAIAVFADRLFGFISIVTISLTFLAFNWSRIRDIPALSALSNTLLIALAASAVVAVALRVAPNLALYLERRLSRWPSVAALVARTSNVAAVFQHNPLTLLIAFVLSLLI